MHPVAIALSAGALLMLFGSVELVTRHVHPLNEVSRKSIHILSGVFVAFFPFWLSYREIALLSVAFTILLAISKHWNILTSIHGTKRHTYGEVLFPAGICATALLAPPIHTYMYALLVLALSDGLAGLIGSIYAHRYYHLFGNTKSYIGSSVFLMCTITIGYSVVWRSLDGH